ncbi:hypothetical protein S83_062316, partial [Arachis hypogaea]
ISLLLGVFDWDELLHYNAAMQAWKKRIISFMLPSDLNTCLGWKTDSQSKKRNLVKKWTSNYNNYAIGSHVMD